VSTQIDTMRAAIKAGITAITGLSTVPIEDVIIPAHAFGRALRKPTICLAYGGTQLRGSDNISTVKQSLVFVWTLTIVTESWRAPALAGDRVLGIEEVAERLRGTAGVEDGLRAVEIVTISGDGLRLRFVSEQVAAPPDRPEQAGPAALIQTWHTFPEVIL